MTDQKKPEELSDEALDDAKGGYLTYTLENVAGDKPAQNRKRPGRAKKPGEFGSTAGGSPNV